MAAIQQDSMVEKGSVIHNHEIGARLHFCHVGSLRSELESQKITEGNFPFNYHQLQATMVTSVQFIISSSMPFPAA